MKTFFKYCLFIFALAFSQMSWALDSNCPKTMSSANCKNPTCTPGKTTWGTDTRKCIDSCKDGYSSTSSADFICYKNCRDGYSTSTVGMCHYTGGGTTYTKSCHTEKISCSYYKGTKVIKKCSGGGTKCDGCRDGYRDDGLICSYRGAWDYAKDSYLRTDTIRWKDTCENGWEATVTDSFWYYCKKCDGTPSTTTNLAITSGSYYNLSGTPNPKVIQLQSNLTIVNSLCNASANSSISTTFVMSNNGTTCVAGKETANCKVATCTFPSNVTGKNTGSFTCNVSYNLPAGMNTNPNEWKVTGESKSTIGNIGTKLTSPDNNGNLSFTLNP